MKKKEHAIRIDDSGNIEEISGEGYGFVPSMPYSLFELDGEIARAERLSETSFRLAAGKNSGTLSVSMGRGISLRCVPEEEVSLTTVGVVLPFSLETEFHLPEYRSTGRMIDRDMPLGESYSGSAAYNFLLARTGSGWLRFMVEAARMSTLSFQITRHPEAFLLSVSWPVEETVRLEFFSGMDEAQESFRAHLKSRFGVTSLAEEGGLPKWIHDVRMVFTVDMLRSNGEICHDYDDVAALADDLAEAGCPPNTLFYLPGWNGDYDAAYPTYRPHADLGGEEKFRAMMKALHARGYRVIVHTNPRGVDPSHPDLERFVPLLHWKEDGSRDGWQIQPGQMPPSATLKFRTGRICFPQPAEGGRFSFETVEVLDACEALIRLGGVRSGSDGTRVTIGRRSQVVPPGVMEDGHAFPYAFALVPGRNRVELELLGEPEERDGEGWYEISRCYRYPDPYAPWTYPIQHADTNNPGWIEIFVGEIERAVREYGVDAVHLDAATLSRPYDNHRLFSALKERIPRVPIGGEWCATLEDVGYWTFCQGAVQSLIANTKNAARTRDCNSIPPVNGVEELYRWLDKPSPVCGFVKDYFYCYLHLCAADAFVPVGKVCNILPERKMPLDGGELWTRLRNAARFGAIPNLRVNYRKYGLDEETRRAVMELTR